MVAASRPLASNPVPARRAVDGLLGAAGDFEPLSAFGCGGLARRLAARSAEACWRSRTQAQRRGRGGGPARGWHAGCLPLGPRCYRCPSTGAPPAASRRRRAASSRGAGADIGARATQRQQRLRVCQVHCESLVAAWQQQGWQRAAQQCQVAVAVSWRGACAGPPGEGQRHLRPTASAWHWLRSCGRRGRQCACGSPAIASVG